MASAEQLLNEAQYAFTSINGGESRDNRRNTARAISLCKKIIRTFPASTEAASAHAILKRLGDEAYTSKLHTLHRHSVEHKPMQPKPKHAAPPSAPQSDQLAILNWRGLLEVIFNMPLSSWVAIAAAMFVLFTIFGPLLLLPFVVLVFIFGSIKGSRKKEQVDVANKIIERINSYIDHKRSASN